MLARPETWSDVLGNKEIVRFFTEHAISNTLPSFIILTGPSGVGKTTIARLAPLSYLCEDIMKPCYKCKSCTEHIDNVIKQNRDTTYTILKKMTSEGTKEKMNEMISLFNNQFMEEDKHKFIILDEAHSMTAEAQDAILVDTEYLPPNVHVIMLTTDISQLKEEIISRAVLLYLKALSKTDMLVVLRREALRRNLVIEQSDIAYNIIMNWSDFKPRRALKVLEALGENKTISLTSIQEYVSYIDTKNLIPLISSFAGHSFMLGIETITKMEFDANSKNFIVDFLVDVLRLKHGIKKVALSAQDSLTIRNLIQEIPEETLGLFLAHIAGLDKLDKAQVLSVYLKVHPALFKLAKGDSNALSRDSLYKVMYGTDTDVGAQLETKRQPNLDRLERGSVLVGEVSEIPTLDSLINKGKQ